MTEDAASPATAFKAFDDSIKSVEEVLRPLLAAVDAIRQSEDPDEIPAITKARVHATLAYAVNALYYIYLQANAAETEEHPIATEIERVQNLFSRLRAVERKGKDDEDKKARALRKSAKKLDMFLTPEEEDLFHAVKGNASKRQRHKRFPSDDEKKSASKKRKGADADIAEDEPAVSTKTKIADEAADEMEVCTPDAKKNGVKTPGKEPSVNTPASEKSGKKSKSSSKKKSKKTKKAK